MSAALCGNYLFLQGRESGLSERAGRTVWALLSEVSGAKPSRAKQRWERAGDQPQGERYGAAEEGEPGESSADSEKGTRQVVEQFFHV